MERSSRNSPLEPLWTADEVAEFLGLHVQTVYQKARAGDIPSVKIGRRTRFRPGDIREMVGIAAGDGR